ncbi:hypothetical protein [Micromonospora okii]|uniref:hypothetical protein n=1 Tax=Micromonospora okii TaxID=1182970 RepID=UPI001E5AE7D8|nr:hypothetical protein [Micromonospora okii]
MTRAPADGIRWIYAGMILGLLASIAFNVGHAFIAPAGASASWAPSPGRILFGVFLPAAVGILLEVLTRVAWPHSAGSTALRFLGVGSVALAAGYVSYLHTSGVLAHWGEDRRTQVLGALAVDGLLVMCSTALVLIRRAPAEGPSLADRLGAVVDTLATAEHVAPPAQTFATAPAQPAPTADTYAPAPAPHADSWAPALDAVAAPVEAVPPAVEVEAPADVETAAPAPADPRRVTAVEIPAAWPSAWPTDPTERRAEIRRVVTLLKAEHPKRSQRDIEALTGVPRWTLRDALAEEAAPAPTSPPVLQLVSTS